jgi:hypothetical protein
MIARELLEELETVRRNFDWYYDGPTQRIRGQLKGNHDIAFDPIGAVCFARTGVTFGETDWLRAAEMLELSHIDAADLTAAANNVVSGPGLVYTQNLRRQLIDGVLPEHSTELEEQPARIGLIAGFIPALRRKAHGVAKS